MFIKFMQLGYQISACIVILFYIFFIKYINAFTYGDQINNPVETINNQSNRPTSQQQLIIEADKIEGNLDEKITFSGDVRVYNSPYGALFATLATYNTKDKQITAGDNTQTSTRDDNGLDKFKSQNAMNNNQVVFVRDNDLIQASWIAYYINLSKGVALNASVYQRKTGVYAFGEQITMYNQNEYSVNGAYFTTCDPQNPSWHIAAKQINFDYQESNACVYSGKFYIRNIPVLFAPYINFPLGKRKTGFLFPEFMYNSGSVVSGLAFGVPFYWNIAPNYDMTTKIRQYFQHGTMLGNEFRYLNHNYRGNMYGDLVLHQSGDFKQLNNNVHNRYYVHLDHQQNINNNLFFSYDYQSVSDKNYFIDFNDFYGAINNVNLERSATIQYINSFGYILAKLQSYQVLQEQTTPIYVTTPQIESNTNNILPSDSIEFKMFNQYTVFTGRGLQSGERMVSIPNIDLPLVNTWGFIKPRISYYLRGYKLGRLNNSSNKDESTVNQAIPIYSIDNGLMLNRNIQIGKYDYIQTLEPRLYYLYIPRFYQGNIPLFDTAEASYSIDRLFSYNRFSGYDRLNNSHSLTIGSNSKLLSAQTSYEIMNFGVGYKYYIDKEELQEYGDRERFKQLFLSNPTLITEVNNAWAYDIATNFNFQYDAENHVATEYGGNIKYHHNKYEKLSLGYLYQHREVKAIYNDNETTSIVNHQQLLDFSIQWKLLPWTERVFGSLKTEYNLNKNKANNVISAIEYNGGCWSTWIGAQTFLDPNTLDRNIYVQKYFLNFELRGLSSIGSSRQSLSKNIYGYQQTAFNDFEN